MQAAFERAGAEETFRLNRLAEPELPARVEHGHHCGSAGASGRAVELAGAEYVHVLVEGAGQSSLVPECDEVEVADVALRRVLQFDLLSQHLAGGDADLRQPRAGVRADLEALSADVDYAEIVAAPDDVGAHAAKARHIKGDVLRCHVGRHILETAPGHAVALVHDLAGDRAGRGLEANSGAAVLAPGHHTQRHHGHRNGNRSVSAHVRILRTVDPDQARIEAGLRRGREEHAEHVLVPARLSHQRGPYPVELFLEELALLQDVRTPGGKRCRNG